MIEVGDSVRHKPGIINGGLQMTAQDIKNGQVKCEYFAPPAGDMKEAWLPIEDLELIYKADGGFRNEGER